MWNFSNLARPVHHPYPHAFGMGRHPHGGYAGRFGHPNRAGELIPASKKDALMEAGIHKGTAVLTSGVVGAISAYKGLPEIKGTAGLLSFDVIVGLLLGGLEMAMIAKGAGGKKTAAVGGISTGLLCHYAAVNGTIWGAGKAKAESMPVATKGVDYNAHERQTRSLPDARRNHGVPAAGPAPAVGKSFDPYYGMM